MLKVIFFAPRPFSLTFGGSEIQLLETKAALEALGISVEFANYFSMDQISKGSVVHLFGSDYIFAQLSRLLKGKGVPYVVSPIFYPIGLEKLAHKISSFLPTTAASLRKNVLLGASRILPNSKSEARLLADVFSVPQKFN
ncbi:MAG: hypothetical protein RML14_11730 [Meiothermus sp.]|uniref:hypothetical protein n=1 Tax=Meiothermus sp. TaxID=1955249 RepID=UPI00298F2B50|nr:hypothetical protein [Meiothermus sp.]MDW8482507.1 hypothetical protein [Meiothermus sp.]